MIPHDVVMREGAAATDRTTYWRYNHISDKKCNAKGRDSARCVLPPHHGGAHEGPGFDEWGPLYRCWMTKPDGARR